MSQESTIIAAVKVLIKNKDKISNVINAGGGDYLFLFDKKQKWMFKTNGPTFDLRLYNKGSHSLDDIAALDDLSSVEFSVIPTSELRNQADIEVLRDLQDILKYKDREFGSEINDLLTKY